MRCTNLALAFSLLELPVTASRSVEDYSYNYKRINAVMYTYWILYFNNIVLVRKLSTSIVGYYIITLA